MRAFEAGNTHAYLRGHGGDSTDLPNGDILAPISPIKGATVIFRASAAENS